jgi:soluble lytic murein transglycosylase-like protein
VLVGVDFLAELLDRYDGNMAKALVAYNRGHYAGTITQYARDVLAKAEELAVIA